MTASRLEALASGEASFDPENPVLLYQQGDHRVYWMGIEEETSFRCNVYLLQDGDETVLIDPGNRAFFPVLRARLERLLPAGRPRHLLLCHQDPDVAASLPDWHALDPEVRIFSSPRTEVLLPHYGVTGLHLYDIEKQPLFSLPSGAALRFIPAPFLHSPMAFATLDTASGFLFSGDLFAALDIDWQLVIRDFASHRRKLDLFHLDYMASNAAALGFVRRLKGLTVTGILPQHGSVIPPALVPEALDYLRNLQCGLDLLYPDLML